MRALAFLLAGLLLAAPGGARAACDGIDDPLQVLDLHLEMDPAAWAETLRDNNFQDDGSGATERPARFRCGDEPFIPCLVRRKRSLAIPSEAEPVKVSLKIDFDDPVRNGEWHGHRKLSLENGGGGVLLSEGLSWLLMRQAGVIAGAAAWVRLHVNGEPIGIYLRVEQVDRRFLRRHLGEDAGFLYKNGVRESPLGLADPHAAALCYAPFGSGCAPPSGLAGLAELCDLPQLLGLGAVDAFLSNWDSLFGNGNNFFHYSSDRPRLHFPWDVDRGLSPDARSDPRSDPFDLLPEIAAHDVLLADPAIRDAYRRILGRLIADPFRPEVMERMLDEVLEAVGPAIRGDPLNGLEGGLDAEASRLRAWIRVRHHSILERLAPIAPPAVVINEVLASNGVMGVDEAGEADDWVEILNRGSSPAPLASLSLSDDPAHPARWPLPDVVLAPGAHLLVWCDGEPEEGPLHAGFKLDADGEGIGLYSFEGDFPRVIDFVRFRPQETDRSLGRLPDGAPGFRILDCPTPAAPNRTSCPPAAFRRGDADGDGTLSITDPVRVLQALFLGGVLGCRRSADADDDGEASITDAIRLLGHLFLGGDAPPAPFPGCGHDSTPDGLDCRFVAACPAP